jgi:dolichyl-phosphate-mannose--protein O-mannosyl transferase
MSGIFMLSVTLRFWGLGRFNALVFDEVYYAKFANNYLTGTHFFNAHPPLSQYIIAIGMWLGSHLPFGQDTVNGLTGSLRSTWSYRWLNALTGSFIPLVVAALAYQLNQRRSYAFIAALFAAADGLFLVESRYALNNVYLVILGLLGQLCFLVALGQPKQQRGVSLALSGVFFGASACIKWNGLWFLLGVYMVWVAAWVMQWVRSRSREFRNQKYKTLPDSAGQT